MTRLAASRTLATGFAAFLLSVAPLGAQVVNNGLPDGLNGNEMTAWIQAEDFTLSGTTTLTAATFWGFGFDGSYQGSIYWQIFSDNAGAPGTSLFGGLATPTTTSYPGGSPNLDTYPLAMQLDFALPSLLLGGGSYWFALHNGPLSTTNRAEFYWATTALNGTGTAEEDDAPFGDNLWSNNGQEHAFALYGTAESVVPEPGTMSLLAMGLAGMVGAARKRRKA